MIDGTYKFDVNTPLGRKTVLVTLRGQGSTAIINVDAPIVGKKQTTGDLDGDTFFVQGSLKVPMIGKVTFAAKGTVVGDELRVAVDSNKGQFNPVGIRVKR